ncbi:MAG: amidohydrolase [Chlamydiia bacterium]|nr:amidohydrolase [Chlamydiia bacterium]
MTIHADLIINNGTVLTEDGFQEKTVMIKGTKITALDDTSSPCGYTGKKVIDAAGKLVLPGMVNCHTHNPMVMYRGLGNDCCDIIHKVMFPLEKKFTDSKLCGIGAELTAAEMIKAGVTCFADMYYFVDTIAEVVEKVGLRAILGETVIKYPSPDAPEPYGGIKIARQFVEKWNARCPRITPAYAPHAPYSVEKSVYKEIADLAAADDVPILTHLAEIANETPGLSPVDFLDEAGALSKRLVAAHCIHVTDADIAKLKDSEAGIAFSILGNVKGGSPIPPIQKIHKVCQRVGLATDGPMSSNTQDIFSQMRFVGAMVKYSSRDRSALPANEIVKMATIGGARALHMEDRIGTLTVGKEADVIIVDVDAWPTYDYNDYLVYSAFATSVRTTIVAGKILMEDRKLTTINEEALKNEAQPLIEAIASYNDTVIKGSR